MKRLSLLLLLASAAPAWAQDVIVRGHVEPQAGAVVGQHVRLMIDVLFRDTMPHPPRVSIAEVPGAQILRTESQATTMSDRIDGEAYIGQRFEFALYARRGGSITVPAAVVALLDANGDETGSAAGPQLRAEISVPAGVDPSQPLVATDEVTLEQQWSPALSTHFKSGDALVRTIIRTAADVPGMAMRDLPFPEPPGVRVYADPPQSEDRQDRGAITGRRIDRITYVFEGSGTIQLPGVTQPWWDLSAGRLRQATGSGVTVVVTAPPQPFHWEWPAAIAVAVAALGLWLLPRLRRMFTEMQGRWSNSETKAFRDLRSACRGSDVASVYRAFVIWRRRTPSPRRLDGLAVQLEQALVGSGTPEGWSRARGTSFMHEVKVARHGVKRTTQQHATRAALPALNP